MKPLEIKLKLDNANFQKEIEQNRAAIKSLDKEKANIIIDLQKEQLEADFAKIKAELSKIDNTKTEAEIAIEQDRALTALTKLRQSIKELDDTKIDINVDANTSKLANAIAEIKTGISREVGAKIAEGIAVIPGAIAQTTLQFEKLQTVLKTTLGSQGEADKAFALIKDFAASTPFQVSSITDAFIKLTNRGVKPTRESLTQLGDLASSQGKELDQLVEAILDASTGENERLKEFGIQASKSGDQVTFSFKGVQKTVANTPEAINAAILSFGQLQGVAGGMEAQSKTLGGALSNLQDVGDTLAVAFGQELTPILLEIVKGFSESGASAEGFARGAGQNVGAAIKFLVDNADTLKTILELVAIRFALVKGAAIASTISTLAAGTAAAAGSVGFAALGTAAAAATFSLIAILAPIAAVVAAIKLIDVAKFEELNTTLETSTKTAQSSGNETARLAARIKSLGEARKAGNGDPKKEKAYLDLAEQQIKTIERLKKEEQDRANLASDPEQKQAFLNNVKGYEAELRSLKSVTEQFGKINVAKTDSAKKTKEQIKDEQELAKLAKAKADIDRAAQGKKDDLFKDKAQKQVEKVVETERDTAIDNLKTKQDQESAKFKQDQENALNEKKRGFEREIADFKEGKEKGIEDQKRAFEKSLKNEDLAFQKKKQADEKAFQKQQQSADEAFQKEKQNREKAFQDSLSGAKGIIDRESKLGTAKPEDRAKLEKQFAEEDRIRQAVLSTNVDTKSTKEQFAQQAKQIAGVGQIASQEDAAKVQLALAELEAKAKAQFAEEERAKEAAFKASQQAADEAFKQKQQAADIVFKDTQDAAKLNFEQNVLAPQKKALEQEIEAKKLAFEQGTLQPLKVQQEAELAAFKKAQDVESNALKESFETKLEAIRMAAKLKEIDLDAQAQKLKLDSEAAFKDGQRAKDLDTARQVVAILSSSKLQSFGIGAAAGIGDLKNVNLKPQATPAPASASNGDPKYNININSSKDPNRLLSEALQQIAGLEITRRGL